MNDTYTPTTEEVRDRYIAAALFNYSDVREGEVFDRWLAAHDAEVAAKVINDWVDHFERIEDRERPDGDDMPPVYWDGANDAADYMKASLRARAAEYRKAVQDD